MKDCIALDLENHIETVIEKFSMKDSNPSKILAENILKLVKANEDEQLVDENLYRSLVGSFFCIEKQTRPYLIWIVNVFSRFMEKPTNYHWLAGTRVFGSLQATKSLKLTFPHDNDFILTGENEADWSGNHDGKQSTTGYFFTLRLSGGAVIWQNK